jgi:hypothetical protein
MKYLIAILIFFAGFRAFAQQSAYIPPAGQVWNFGNTALFGNMQQEGTLGSNPNTLFYFLGKRWVNGSAASLPDESAGGISGAGGTFRFSSNNTLYGNTGQQSVFGAYSVAGNTGASFPNLEVSNAAGLLLEDLSDLKIRNTLNFNSGHIFLNGWNLSVGQNSPGTITGYSDQRFVVTGTGAAGGFLYREGLTTASGRVVFPVGTSVGNYAPAAIATQGAPDDFKVRVFDNIYQNAVTGSLLQDTFIYKTWNIGHTQTGKAQTDVILQHMNAAEMPVYEANRDSSYIIQYTGSAWDRLPQLPYLPQTGSLTTQPMGAGATMHLRSFPAGLASDEYFSKTIGFPVLQPPANFILFNAWRISIDQVRLEWATSREVNNAWFEIERRFEGDTGFTRIARVPTKARGGYSNTRLDYTYLDNNNYDGWTYYRIKAVSRTGQYIYTEIRAVPPLIQIDVYPNPNMGQFHVRIRGIRSPLVMQLMNTWGQVLRQYDIQGDGDVEVREVPAAMYFLVLYHKSTQQVAYRCKVEVLGRQ